MTGPDDIDVVRGGASSDDVHALHAALLRSAHRTVPAAADPLSNWRSGRRRALQRHPEAPAVRGRS